MNDVCSHELLASAVARALSPDDEVVLHAHLEHCETCCARMEELAGGESWRQETATHLRGDELDDAVPESAMWSEADFSVEHLEPSDDASVMGSLGGYDVVDIVGRGGMGVVVKAFDRELKRFVAIKVLAPHLAHSSVARKRFAREAQAAAAVVNPHVIAIHHVQPAGRLPFLVMPLLAGESLAQRLKARGPLALTEVLRIGMQAAAGLAAAHDQGLVHRDVKPANLLLEKGVERVVITDFGLARAADDVSMTRLGVVAGTPEYMSPEQARGETLDGRSDLFSLGCVLYEMASGVSPFRADSTMATLRRVVEEKPAAIASLGPELPPWFAKIVERLLEKVSSDRFSSAREVSELLEECLSHLQQPRTTPLPAVLMDEVIAKTSASRRKWSGKPRRFAAMAIIGAIGFVALAMLFWQSTEPPDIAGAWTGDEWGQVELEAIEQGAYRGTYTDTFGEGKGKLQLEWSRVERRFNGKWKEGKERFGEISVRLVDDQIRGAWTTSHESELNSGTPHLADLLWRRSVDRDPEPGSKPAAEAVHVPPVNVPQGTSMAELSLIRRLPIVANVRSIAISPDGERIAFANHWNTFPVGDNWQQPVEILDAKTGAVSISLEVISDLEATVFAATPGLPRFDAGPLAFSPDGNVLAVGNGFGQLKLFDSRSGERLLSFDDEAEKRAETKSSEELKSLDRAMGDISSLAFSPDGRYLAACGDSFHDAARHWDGVTRFGGRLVTGPGRLKVWDVASGKLVHDLAGHSHAHAVAYSFDGSMLASAGSWNAAGEDGSGVVLWNSATGEKVRTLPTDTNGGAWSVAISPNGHLVAIVSWVREKNTDASTSSLSLFRAGTGVLEWTQTVPGWGQPAAFMPDGKSLAMLCGEQWIRFFAADTGSMLQEIRSEDTTQSAPWKNFAISPSGPTLAVGGSDAAPHGSVEVWGYQAQSTPAASDPPSADVSKALLQFEGDWDIEPDETRVGASRYEGVFCFRRGNVLHLSKGKILLNGKFTIDPTINPATFHMEREDGDHSRGVRYLHGEYEFRPDGGLWLEIPDTDVRPGASITQPNRLLKLRRPGDDRMQGDWVLESVTGRGLRAMEPGLKVNVRQNIWTIDREAGKTTMRLSVNPYAHPDTIDMTALDENADWQVSRGLYRIKDDVLELYWSPKPDVRPAALDDRDVSIHTYRRAGTPAEPSDAGDASAPDDSR